MKFILTKPDSAFYLFSKSKNRHGLVKLTYSGDNCWCPCRSSIDITRQGYFFSWWKNVGSPPCHTALASQSPSILGTGRFWQNGQEKYPLLILSAHQYPTNHFSFHHYLIWEVSFGRGRRASYRPSRPIIVLFVAKMTRTGRFGSKIQKSFWVKVVPLIFSWGWLIITVRAHLYEMCQSCISALVHYISLFFTFSCSLLFRSQSLSL